MERRELLGSKVGLWILLRLLLLLLLLFLRLLQASVETIMKQEAKEAEKRSRQRAAAEKRRDESAKSLFDFINVKIVGGKAAPKGSKNGFSNNKSSSGKSSANVALKEESDKNIKIRHFEIGEKVTKVEREISRYKESYQRLRDKDPKAAANVKTKIEEKMVELKSLQHKEQRLKQEDGSRKSKSKLSIF